MKQRVDIGRLEELVAQYPSFSSTRTQIDLQHKMSDERSSTLTETWDEPVCLRFTVMSLSFTVEGEERLVENIILQDVPLLRSQQREISPERVELYFHGWLLAMEHVWAQWALESSDMPLYDALSLMHPIDLMDTRVLNLKRPRDAEGFRDAFLQRSRLGRLLPS